MIGNIKNLIERDRVIAALKTAPDKMLSRQRVRDRYVDDYMRGALASVGIWTGKHKIGSPSMWITVNVETTECWFYAPAISGPVLVHEEKNVEIRDMVAARVAKLAPQSLVKKIEKQGD